MTKKRESAAERDERIVGATSWRIRPTDGVVVPARRLVEIRIGGVPHYCDPCWAAASVLNRLARKGRR